MTAPAVTRAARKPLAIDLMRGAVNRPNRPDDELYALDLFCGAGGATRGLQRAGFHVTGVDIEPQPRYCGDHFIQGDALAVAPWIFDGYDFVWTSPPCQAHTAMKTMHNAKEHIDLIEPTRAMLNSYGVMSWVIENVVGAPLEYSVKLCGTMFGLETKCGAQLQRHRLFETSFPILGPRCQHGLGGTVGVYGGHVRNRKRTIGVYGEGCRDSRRKSDKGVDDFTVEDGRDAMQIDWMTLAELCQAIPPAYSEFIAKAWLAQRESEAA